MFANTTTYSVEQPDGSSDIVFGLMRIPLQPDSSDQTFVVDQRTENRLDLVSYQVYGTPQLFWAIAALNNIIDLHAGIPIGTQLRIPIQSRIPTL